MLAGDLGATKTLLGLFRVKDYRHGSLVSQSVKEFSSRDHSTFKKIADEFLSASSIDIESITQVTLGIAGPVTDGHSRLTNVPWELDEKALSDGLGIRKVKLLNDLEATAFYVPFLKEDERQVLYQGEDSIDEQGLAAVIAPGTGLGEAFLTWSDGRYHAHASEGGHCDFAPTTETQDGMLQHLRRKFGHVSYELVCSGKGIYNTWSYFHESENIDHPDIQSQISRVDDPTPIIVETIMKQGNDCEACQNTLDTFVSVLAAESGNLALKFLPKSGVYIAGGLPRLMLSALTNGKFIEAYLKKGRMSNLVSRFPVRVILTQNSVLLGAAHYTLDSLQFEQHDGEMPRERVANLQEV